MSKDRRGSEPEKKEIPMRDFLHYQDSKKAKNHNK